MPNRKHYPVQRNFMVAQGPGPANNVGRIDVHYELSRINHRLYRESRTYECSISIDANLPDATTVDVYALADTWYLKGALKLAKSAWDMSNAEEIAMNNGHVARWNDFRIGTGVASAQMQAIQFNRGSLSPQFQNDGEFEFAKVSDQTGTLRTFTLGAATASEYDIFDEYDKQPGTSSDPLIPSNGPYNGLLPNLDTVAAQAISEDGNEPPYKADGYGNAIWVKVGTLHLQSGRQRLSTGFFMAPLGKIVLTGVAAIGENADLSVSIKGGDYKGVMSHSMLE